MKAKIATRKSELAQYQADLVIKRLLNEVEIETEKLLIVTEGDKKLDVSLDKIGGKGVFTKEIENTLLTGEAIAAVHSLKDIPYKMDERFAIASIPERVDPRDAFVSKDNTSFFDLPSGAIIGTSSLRRSQQLKLMRDDIVTVPLRGNIHTRIGKIESENLDGIVLAAAGLIRLGLADRITHYFSIDEIVPAVGQGALCIQTLDADEKIKPFNALENKNARICIDAEREFMGYLNGGCHTCVGAIAQIEGNTINISGVFDLNGKVVKKKIKGPVENNLQLGTDLAKLILKG